jgi:signal transduction histidine kinase
MAQRDELKEVLLNVLENARLAQARNVTVRLSRARVQDSERVLLHVEDDGGGIASALLDRVFEPHFSTRTSGSGLGLAISRRLIESWGGSIMLQSTPDVGTTVEISLPVTG